MFSHTDPDGDDARSGIGVSRADGGHVRWLLTIAEFQSRIEVCCEALELLDPTWSPGGRRLAFSFQWSDDDDQARTAIYTAHRNGRAIRRLHDGQLPAWSPRGNVIAFVTGTNDDGIATSRPDGSRFRTVLRDARVAPFGRLDFSPDGRKLLYLRASPHSLSPDRIVIVDLAHGKRRLLRPSAVTAAVWAPDGKKIAYATNDDPTIRTIRRDGTRIRRLMTADADVDWLSWAAR